jgi:hypothetical protein
LNSPYNNKGYNQQPSRKPARATPIATTFLLTPTTLATRRCQQCSKLLADDQVTYVYRGTLGFRITDSEKDITYISASSSTIQLLLDVPPVGEHPPIPQP